MIKTGRIRKTLILIGFILFFVFCCKNKKPISFYLDSNNFVNFQLNDNNLKQPFQIASDSILENGSIYFKTATETIWLEGNPLEIVSRKNKFEGKWLVKDRHIIISLVRKSDKYNFSFTAIPDTDIVKWGFSVAASDSEYFTGLFERVVDGNQKESWREGIQEALNIRGQEIDMSIKATLSLYCPFYLSSNGYGLFITGTSPGHYDLCKTNSNLVSIEFEGSSLQGIIYTADNPADIVKSHSLHVGPTILPPKWAFLPFRWRDNHTNNATYYDRTPVSAPYNSMVVEDILMMKAYDIPCGVYWVDRPWATGKLGYDDFTWDSVRFPKAEKMIEWLHDNDTRFLLWIAPWVAGNMRLEAIEKGYTQPIIPYPGGADSTNVASLDFTNPEARKWWQQKGIEKMLKQGVDGFKMDRSEEEVPDSDTIILNDGRTLREARNEYPVLYLKTVNESSRKIKENDFLLLPRAGYSGSAKYGTFWGGDIAATPEGLRAAIIAIQRCAVIGFPIWGSDIGGYWQGKLDREVCARWLAFGCFNPVMEFGPTDDRAPWDMPTEPAYDTALIATWRLYAKIHTELKSYSYGLAKEANKTGMPIVRPLFLVYPDQKEAWEDWRTFLYGPDILVSAVWKKGVNSHICYLPAGTTWIDAWDPSKVYEGGQWVEINTPFHKIPIFLKEGASLFLGNLNDLYSQSYELARKKPDLKALEKQYIK